MSNRTVSRKWQVRLSNWIGGSQYGVLITGVRRRGRGDWLTLDQAPKEVVDYLYAKQTKGAGRWYCPEFHTIEALKAGVIGVDVRPDAAYLFCVVDEQVPPPRPRPIHRAVKSVVKDASRDGSLSGFARSVYRSTSTGVSVGFCVDGVWLYGGSLPSTPMLDLLKTAQVTGFSATGYCEGVDCDPDPHFCDGKVVAADIWKAIDAAEQDGLNLWNDTHGCECCGPESESGFRAINPSCKACNGNGMVI